MQWQAQAWSLNLTHPFVSDLNHPDSCASLHFFAAAGGHTRAWVAVSLGQDGSFCHVSLFGSVLVQKGPGHRDTTKLQAFYQRFRELPELEPYFASGAPAMIVGASVRMRGLRSKFLQLGGLGRIVRRERLKGSP